ncbi:hypothetical protein BH09CHL1_BH09CHL1_26850 [soil metagenome]
MHRLFRVTAVFVAMFMLVSGLRFAPSAAAQDGAGITSDTTYESPTFGFEVEWDEAWVAQEDSTTSDDSGDLLYLFSEEYGAAVSITAIASNGNTPDAALETYRGYLEETYGELTETEFETADPDYPAFVVTYDLNGSSIDDYVQTSIYEDALIVTSVRTSAGLGLIVAILASTAIQFDGENLLPSYTSAEEPDETPTPDEDETPTPEDDDRPVSRDETPEVPNGYEGYESPTYGVTLAYDPELWSEEENTAAEDSSNERDLLLLESLDDDVPANLYLETYDSVTKASDCFDTAVEESVGDIADAEVLEDRSGDPIEGSERGLVYGAYSFETSDGDPLVAYIECRAIPGGGGVFAITLITIEDAYEDAFDALTDILDTVSLDGTAAEPDETEEPEETPDTPSNNSGEYESPTYGFTFEYGRGWDAGDDTSEDGLDQIILNGPDGITLLVQGYEPTSSRHDAQDCVEGYAESYATAVEVEVTQVTNTETDEPIAGEDDFGYYSLYAYDVDGETRTLYVECGESPDGDYMVLYAAETSIDSVETILDEVLPIIESTNF